ncbi:MAG TPA: tetratricopeptide repeat protein, partial [Pseudonocardiaceae bacterium]|nr:tetratricopeptide repeat protein [Pseudonocardiaceae bacterium]
MSATSAEPAAVGRRARGRGGGGRRAADEHRDDDTHLAGGGGLLAAVVVWVGLTLWQADRAEQDRVAALRAARADVLEPMQPTLQGTPSIRTLLAAEHALAPFRARGTETAAVTRWCLDPAAPAVHVLAGPSGVGKSRLALEVARQLADSPQVADTWVTGRCVSGQAAHVLPAVLACREPTLVVVDDADTEPGVASLVKQVGDQAQRGEVKVLLLVREAAVFERWLDAKLPDAQSGHLPSMTLAVVGGSGDRRRWFVEAARAYAAALGVPPPPVSDTDTRPVGADGDPMIVTQARAVLAALAGTRERADAIRTASIDRVAAGLIEHERQRWERAAGDPHWSLPQDLTAADREEALLALVLLAPATFTVAVGVLQRLPLFHNEAELFTNETERPVRHVVQWAHHLYPGPEEARVEPSPDFLRGALLAGLAQPAHAELANLLLSVLPEQDGLDRAAVLTRLIRAAALFATVAPLVGTIVHHQPELLPTAIESLVLTGPTARVVERHLVGAITADRFTADDVARLLTLLEPTPFTHLRAALQELAVQHAHEALDQDDTTEARARLAALLNNFGVSLWALGRYREALTADEEALRLYRDLAHQEPAHHTPDLAYSLNNLGLSLRELGRDREALTAVEEALRLYRDLAHQEPAH